MFGKLIVCRMKAEILDDIGQTPCFVQILFITMLLEEKFKINQSSSFRRRIMNLVYMSGFVPLLCGMTTYKSLTRVQYFKALKRTGFAMLRKLIVHRMKAEILAYYWLIQYIIVI